MKKAEKSYWCYISEPTFIQKSEDDLKNSPAASFSRKYDNRDKFLSLFCQRSYFKSTTYGNADLWVDSKVSFSCSKKC